MKTRKFGAVDAQTGKKWGGSPITHWRYLKRALASGSIDIPCGECSACCRSGVAIFDDDGREIPKREDGACIHLTTEGWCERQLDRPEHCRQYTCTMESIAGVVMDNPLMNAALAQWQWDLSKPDDREFAEAARQRELQATIAGNLPED